MRRSVGLSMLGGLVGDVLAAMPAELIETTKPHERRGTGHRPTGKTYRVPGGGERERQRRLRRNAARPTDPPTPTDARHPAPGESE